MTTFPFSSVLDSYLSEYLCDSLPSPPGLVSILGTPIGSSSALAFPMHHPEIQLIMASPPCRENPLRAVALEAGEEGQTPALAFLTQPWLKLR